MEGTSESIRGVVIYGEVYKPSLVETYCFLSIITIANEVISSIKKNTPKSDSIIFIISSSIYLSGFSFGKFYYNYRYNIKHHFFLRRKYYYIEYSF